MDKILEQQLLYYLGERNIRIDSLEADSIREGAEWQKAIDDADLKIKLVGANREGRAYQLALDKKTMRKMEQAFISKACELAMIYLLVSTPQDVANARLEKYRKALED